jgi:hypothetical protein
MDDHELLKQTLQQNKQGMISYKYKFAMDTNRSRVQNNEVEKNGGAQSR